MGLDDLVLLIDGGLGGLAVNTDLVCHLFVGFELHVNGLLGTCYCILGYCWPVCAHGQVGHETPCIGV